ncbi:MAG: FRG domain-containing protein [Brevinematales bacterium]|nr:FRG domain-containing protein [Brevinematales bacterium]
MNKIENIDSYLVEQFSNVLHSGYEAVARNDGTIVNNYQKLLENNAMINYAYPKYMLFYRGQTYDIKNNSGHSVFYPTLYRVASGMNQISKDTKMKRINILKTSSNKLIDYLYQRKIINNNSHLFIGIEKLKLFKELQYAILQHYEVCRTPLLDVTQSLRMACNFALHNREGNLQNIGYVFVFGMPYPHGGISYSTEDEFLNIRLSAVCMPKALRPHFQEAYLLGEFPLKTELDLNRINNVEDIFRSKPNFACRLVAKFKINGTIHEEIGDLGNKYIYPDENDEINLVCENIKKDLIETYGTNYYSNI